MKRILALALALFVSAAFGQNSYNILDTPTSGVAGGGTGLTTTTPFSPIFSGATATGAFNASLGPGTSTQVLTSNGAGAYPTWQIVSTTPTFPGTVSGGVSGGIVCFTSTTAWAASALQSQFGVVVGGGAGVCPATSANLTFGGAAAGTGLAIAAGTATTNVNALNITQTWSAAGVSFSGVLVNITNTASTAATSYLQDWQMGGTSNIRFLIGASAGIEFNNTTTNFIKATSGTLNIGAGTLLLNGNVSMQGGNPTIGMGNGVDVNISRVGAGIFGIGTGAAGSIAGGLQLASIGFSSGHIAYSVTAPTIASGFGSSPSIPANNGTAAFTVNVGTGGSASSGVLTMPAATTGWDCIATPSGAPQAAAVTDSAPTSTTSVTLTNYTLTTGVALAWPASTVLNVHCVGY